MCDVGNWIFSKSYNFFEKMCGKVLDFLGGIFSRIFLEDFFLEDFFWRIFFGGFLCRNSLGGITQWKLTRN